MLIRAPRFFSKRFWIAFQTEYAIWELRAYVWEGKKNDGIRVSDRSIFARRRCIDHGIKNTRARATPSSEGAIS